jgi:hypothetical protein
MTGQEDPIQNFCFASHQQKFAILCTILHNFAQFTRFDRPPGALRRGSVIRRTAAICALNIQRNCG